VALTGQLCCARFPASAGRRSMTALPFASASFVATDRIAEHAVEVDVRWRECRVCARRRIAYRQTRTLGPLKPEWSAGFARGARAAARAPLRECRAASSPTGDVEPTGCFWLAGSEIVDVILLIPRRRYARLSVRFLEV